MMNKLKAIFLGVSILTIIGCQNQAKENRNPNERLNVVGHYVSEGYKNRDKGYDWIAVSVSETTNNKLEIKIRSRADKKKPTCTLDAIAEKVNQNTFQTPIEGKAILFQFSDTEMSISTNKNEDTELLNFYCSGGGSLKGIYKKIDGMLDQTQLDK
ncbi:hypothetical protein [Sediminitomix flava]|uniref:Lipoprotein n=1 Tax=Sediminitomix flava TaxID=379075 RepID=A0A315ZCB1_SEDFL|nr:hypothetical protein [Sediminitomix flava]PWJ43216.1 hypothetical protein BC781_102765 [Sediminitomix flava]